MKRIVFCSVGIILIASYCLAAPIQHHIEDDPELTAGYVEGDMVIDDLNRNVLINEAKRWPGKTVRYIITEGHFSPEHIDFIKRGLKIIEEATCVRFEEAQPDDKYYVSVTSNGDGCFSNVGFANTKQRLNLQIYPVGTGCFRMGTIVHEFMHTLGIYHQQSASNRDDYVRIAEENIQENRLHNFNKYSKTEVDDFNQEYDYGSVMHYSAYAFTKNGEMTIIPKNPNISSDIMGQRRSMSKSDINKINSMYRCRIGI